MNISAMRLTKIVEDALEWASKNSEEADFINSLHLSKDEMNLLVDKKGLRKTAISDVTTAKELAGILLQYPNYNISCCGIDMVVNIDNDNQDIIIDDQTLEGHVEI